MRHIQVNPSHSKHSTMKINHLIAAATFGLAAALSVGTATAATVKLFDLSGEALFSTPSFGTTNGIVLVDDGTLISATTTPPNKHLLLDSQGVSPPATILGTYAVPSVPASISYFQYGFSVATATTFGFFYNFLTSTAPNAGDFFVGALFNSANVQTNLFAETSSSSMFNSGSGYLYETGLRYVQFTVGAGNYMTEFVVGTNQPGCLGFGVCVPTAGLLNSVPEPTSLALVGLALLGVASPWARRKPVTLAA